MRIPSTTALFCILFFSASMEALSQDSVDVTFRYKGPPSPQVYLVGEFNGWTAADPKLAMNYIGTYWVITKRLAVGGGSYGGGWEYKFYTGVTPWPDDTLDHHTVPNDPNGNSFIYVKDPTIYQLAPNQRQPMLQTDRPTIVGFIFPKVGAGINASSISLQIDTTTYTSLGSYYDAGTKQFSYQLPTSIGQGLHAAILTAGTTGGGVNSDTVTFTVPGFISISNIGGFTTRNPVRTLRGTVADTSIHVVRIIRNGSVLDSTTILAGSYTLDVNLVEGSNAFKATVLDSSNITHTSDSVTFTYFVNHAPTAVIGFTVADSTITLDGSGSTDPDPAQTALLSYSWSEMPGNPASLSLHATTPMVTLARPPVTGEYDVQLVVRDTSGNADTTRNFFTVYKDSVRGAALNTIPEWVRNGRIYSFYFKGLTPDGTISAALPYLPYFKKMGFNILWILPVMVNHYPIDNASGPGYDITDFYNVAPQYGTNADFKNFVAQAHLLGLKVILDVTPNHTSAGHPFVLNARQYGVNSPYWNFYQHQLITNSQYHPNLSEAITSDNFVYYGGFSSELLNWNWSDVDARQYMIDMFVSWVKNFDVDGYRLDVYWGPHDRANGGSGGENEMGDPLRKALKKVKPSLYLLGETAGTGGGTDVNYADQGGGVDGAYDWNLKDAVHGLYPNGSLQGYQTFMLDLYDGGFYPGGNSSYLRFLENQDEDRIVTVYKSYETTKPPSVAIFTAPGMPMIWEGQELGIGLLVPNGQDPRRAVVNWNQTDFHNLTPHYQRLAEIRAQFPAFSTQNMKLLTSTSPLLAYLRPYRGQDGIVAVNFADTAAQISLQIQSSDLATQIQNKSYVLSDLFHDTSYTVSFVAGSLTVNQVLPAYTSDVFVLADTALRVTLPLLTGVPAPGGSSEMPASFRLAQNYPNPFNPTTVISFDLPVASEVKLRVFDILGRLVATLVDGRMEAGTHLAVFDGSRKASGIYFYVVNAGAFVETRKMILIK